jgi:hypothetical protein
VWKILVGRVSPDSRVTLSRKILGRFTGYCTIVPQASWPQARDRALLKRKRRADSDLRRNDYEKVKEGVVVGSKWKL